MLGLVQVGDEVISDASTDIVGEVISISDDGLWCEVRNSQTGEVVELPTASLNVLD